MKYDYTLYLVTNRTVMSTASLGEAVEQAIAGGCSMIQLREKNISSFAFYTLAKEIKEITDCHAIPLIIKDRIDIALSVGAAGVHTGQSDLPACAARKIMGKDMLLGVSVSTVSEALKAQDDGADYLGVGAMFPTGTKTDANIVTKEELQRIRQAVRLPVVVIGGINRENAASFSNMGVNGLAVVSALISKPDIKAAAQELRDLFSPF